eukprot:741001-Pyramimonas_sp.AAC.1
MTKLIHPSNGDTLGKHPHYKHGFRGVTGELVSAILRLVGRDAIFQLTPVKHVYPDTKQCRRVEKVDTIFRLTPVERIYCYYYYCGAPGASPLGGAVRPTVASTPLAGPPPDE